MIKMNGQRIIRRHFKHQTDENLHGLYQAAISDDSKEAQVIQYLIISELEYRKEKFMKEIKEALNKLNVKGYVTSKWITTDRIAVYIDDVYFGIWDTVRKTFVD